MKKRCYLKPVLCLIFFCCVLWIQCCTLEGGFIGAKVGAKKEAVPIRFWDYQIGEKVKIPLLNGDTISGECRGYHIITREEYEKKYVKCNKQQLMKPTLPELGDSIIIHLTSGEKIYCDLIGFGLITENEEFRYSVIGKKPDTTGSSSYDMNIVAGLSTTQGEFIEKDQLQGFIDLCIIPVNYCMYIKNRDGMQYIAFNEIDSTREPKMAINKKGAVIGLGIGAAIDTIMFYMIYTYETMDTALSIW